MTRKLFVKPRQFLSLCILFLLTMGTHSCSDTETTDNTPFILYYSDMTDIGPSMTGIIASPSYKGSEPYDFFITGVKLNDESFETSSFEIDSTTGMIHIRETAGMPVGLYKISVRCMANGKSHEFMDIVQVNMMKPVPDGISVEPNVLTVDYGELIDTSSEVALPTAQITTEGEHVSISRYDVARSDISQYIRISQSGEISLIRGSVNLLPGRYILSFKLTTGASAEDEGIFENALELIITSRPLEVVYTPATGKIEEESALSGQTSFRSTEPAMKGSVDGLEYSISSVTPATDKIRIEPATGVIYVEPNHGFVTGQIFDISINVKNEFSTEGVVFEDVFQLETTAFIEPIQNFAYPNSAATQAIGFEIELTPGFVGDEVRFEFSNLPAALAGNLAIDHTGKITAVNGNTIPVGIHTVSVLATNPKSDPANPTIATFTLTVNSNPNYFTYVRYGNNLGLSPAENYASQHRIQNVFPYSTAAPQTDASVSLEYSIQGLHQSAGITIDSSTGVITVNSGIATRQCGIVMVTATAGAGTPEEVSIKTPVFFHNSVASILGTGETVTVEYTPFVYQVNPTTGGRSVTPTISGMSNMSQFTMDYRRTFNYYNFNGTYPSGQPNVAGSFMNNVWGQYFTSMGSPSNNTGSRNPMSYYANISDLTKPLAYADPNTYQIVVNPNKWIVNGEAANGVVIGQLTIAGDGKDPQGAGNDARLFPIILWFDSNF